MFDVSDLRTRSRARRRPGLVRGLTIGLVVAFLPTVAGAQPADRAQSVGTLQAQAERIAAELDALDQRTNTLDEQYNNASYELEQLRAEVAANQTQVDAAEADLSETRAAAQQLAIEAFVGNADADPLAGLGGDLTESSHRDTFLAARYGDSEDAIDGMEASRKDLADRRAELDASTAQVDAKVAELASSRAELETTIAERQALFDSVKGELAEALEAERQRMAREAQARAEAEARAAAQRAAAARRPAAVTVTATNGTVRAAVVPPAPVARAVTPPPAGAPAAVQVALEQQGDPYRWAASGPDSFDCSGLVMYAYKLGAGRSLPHSSRALRSMTRSLSADELQPGDLVFGGSPVHHVGIYIGNGQMVHAPHSGDVVKVSSMYSTSKPVSFGRL